MRKIHLLVIDPQNDFCQPDGALYVPGAKEDMERLAVMVSRLRGKLSDIHVTLDSHQRVDISHPVWFRDADGNHPVPFSQITAADLTAGRWTTTLAPAWERTLSYLKALETQGRYAHTIWPEHCLIGSEGHNVVPTLFDAMQEWSERFALVDYVTKGSNPWTEHFSALRAECPDPSDPTTQINGGLLRTLEDADTILLAGEAGSHCVANTVRDIVAAFSDPTYVQKMVLLTDAISPVPGFEHLQSTFLDDMLRLGVKTDTTAAFLAAA